MEVLKPCVSCGKSNIRVDKLEVGDGPTHYNNWFIKCDNCIGITTVTHAVRDEAVRQWDNQWVWLQIDILMKQLKEAGSVMSSMRSIQTEDQRVLQFRYEKIVDEYVKYRMLYSGTAGNINLDERKTLMKKEISAELGWDI